jgi:hypothetical protein
MLGEEKGVLDEGEWLSLQGIAPEEYHRPE